LKPFVCVFNFPVFLPASSLGSALCKDTFSLKFHLLS
jgi:hypothetical protein